MIAQSHFQPNCSQTGTASDLGIDHLLAILMWPNFRKNDSCFFASLYLLVLKSIAIIRRHLVWRLFEFFLFFFFSQKSRLESILPAKKVKICHIIIILHKFSSVFCINRFFRECLFCKLFYGFNKLDAFGN